MQTQRIEIALHRKKKNEFASQKTANIVILYYNNII